MYNRNNIITGSILASFSVGGLLLYFAVSGLISGSIGYFGIFVALCAGSAAFLWVGMFLLDRFAAILIADACKKETPQSVSAGTERLLKALNKKGILSW